MDLNRTVKRWEQVCTLQKTLRSSTRSSFIFLRAAEKSRRFRVLPSSVLSVRTCSHLWRIYINAQYLDYHKDSSIKFLLYLFIFVFLFCIFAWLQLTLHLLQDRAYLGTLKSILSPFSFLTINAFLPLGEWAPWWCRNSHNWNTLPLLLLLQIIHFNTSLRLWHGLLKLWNWM